MKDRKRGYGYKPMAVTVLLIVLMIAASCGVISRINHLEEDSCFERLYDETEYLIHHLELSVRQDTDELELIAEIAAGYEDFRSTELWDLLDSYSQRGVISKMEILLPDDTVLVNSGRQIDAEGRLSFSEEKELGIHITDREKDLEDDRYVVRICAPMVQNGETAAILCGVVDLQTLPRELELNPYSGEAAFYLIDGNTGDFLIDTWHEELGNIWEMGERTMADGYDHEALKSDLISGKNGYVVFVSETTGEYLYFYFAPMSVNEWRAAISVPEEVVFESAKAAGEILYIFVGFEIICFILYFLWMLCNSRKAADEKQRQLDTVNYIYDVEKLLFNAHEQIDNIDKALEKIGYIISAETAGFFLAEQTGEKRLFIWNRNGQKSVNYADEAVFKTLLKHFSQGGREINAFAPEEIRGILPDGDKRSLKNMTAVPVMEKSGKVCGILAGFNLTDHKISSAALKSFSFSFAMFCSNISAYFAIKEQGEKDLLSGLYNRNRYELDLQVIQGQCRNSLSCIYIDVNGLHERNNRLGHEAGDLMLKTVAGQIREKFGTHYSYRIGGDEFLIFAPDMDEREVTFRITEIASALEKKGIYVSVGMQWAAGDFVLDAVIKAAEKKMYCEKKKFYEREENDRRARL